MGFFDKVKKAFGSNKEDVESQNNVNDEIIDKSESIGSLDNDEIQSNDLEETPVNEEIIDKPEPIDSIENDNESLNDNDEIPSEDSEETPVNEEVLDKPTPNDKIRNFKYLDELIHSGAKEIVLDYDIVLGDGEESQYGIGIKLDKDNLVIDGNGHSIDGCEKVCIFYCEGEGITIKNLRLINAENNVIFNEGKIELINCYFKNNVYNYNPIKKIVISTIVLIIIFLLLKFIYDNLVIYFTFFMIYLSILLAGPDELGIIVNKGELFIYESIISENITKKGTPIYNNHGKLKLNKTTIKHNSFKKNFIENRSGEVSIVDCEFLKNKGSQNIIVNNGYLNMYNVNFLENYSEKIITNSDSSDMHFMNFISNYSKYIIFNDKSSRVYINAKFIGNDIKKSVIYNNGISCSLDKSIFENNLSYDENLNNIINQSNLTFKSTNIKDNGKTILNGGEIFIKSPLKDDFKSIIYGEGNVQTIGIPSDVNFDFGYLDKIIHESNTKEIMLKEDIRIEEYERDFYEGGIELDMDNLIIDGNEHTIDGADISRIFLITGKNIILKNIIFKNGATFNNFNLAYNLNQNGGAIQNNSHNLKIVNCTFLSNFSVGMGGAIHNTPSSNINIIGNNFKDNKAEFGGAISNYSKILLDNSNFEKNHSNKGGAIYNCCEIVGNNVMFNNNFASGGGAIFNYGELLFDDSFFKKNIGDSGALYNKSKLIIKNSIFERNINHGFDIFDFTDPFDSVDLINCQLKNNWGRKTKSIINLVGPGIFFLLIYYIFFHEITMGGIPIGLIIWAVVIFMSYIFLVELFWKLLLKYY